MPVYRGPRPSIHQPMPVAPPPDVPVVDQNCISFPLKAITDHFPPELQPALRKHPSEHVEIQIPRALIEPQLSTGAVRLTLAELRGITPEIFFHPDTGNPEAKVQLPLALVIVRIKPPKRGEQRQASVPVNIPSVFAKTGPSAIVGPAVTAKESWYTPRRPTYEPKPEVLTVQSPTTPGPALVNDPPKPQPIAKAAPPAPEPRPITPEPVAASRGLPLSRVTVKPGKSQIDTGSHANQETGDHPVPASENVDSLSIPLHTVAEALPAELQAEFYGESAQTFIVPISEFEPRLRAGRLRFKWSELRGWCVPPARDSSAPDVDVELPMSKVVPLFMAAKRTAPEKRKQVEIDSRIPDVFAKTTPAPVAEPMMPEPVAASPEPPLSPVATESGQSQTATSSEPNPEIGGPAEAAPEPADSLSIPLQTVAQALPAQIQAEFHGKPAQSFVVPLSEFEPRMRAGRLRFKWSELRGWSVPPAGDSNLEDVYIDLPMATVVPLFMAKQTAQDNRKKVEVDSRIPDVFGKGNPAPAPQPEPAPAPAPEPQSPTAAQPAPDKTGSWESRPLRIEQPSAAAESTPAAQIPAPASKPAPQPPAAQSSRADPAEAVRTLRQLDNVTGAFIATSDGLLVAADLTEGNGSVLAAFAPTVFSQLTKFSDMAKLGRPEAIELHLDNTTIHVRKIGKLYLGILMPKGHSLPLAAIAPISSALQPQST
jgi:predicted regulator of Ras-like GTPase activity (Roadblock/LC7/MglB family)